MTSLAGELSTTTRIRSVTAGTPTPLAGARVLVTDAAGSLAVTASASPEMEVVAPILPRRRRLPTRLIRSEKPLEFPNPRPHGDPPSGTLFFSATQPHSTGSNTASRSRFSIDFPDVNLDGPMEGVPAPNVYAECTGTMICDFLRPLSASLEVSAALRRGPRVAAPAASLIR